MFYGNSSFIDQQACYFTFNVVNRTDIFIRPVFKKIIVESLNYFASKKDLQIYSWCLMTNHLHVMCQASDNIYVLAKEFKSFTGKIILDNMDAEPEPRLHWILKIFKEKKLVWENENNPVLINLKNTENIYELIDLIHDNPVRAKIVNHAEDYLHSSAKDYADMKGLVGVQVLEKERRSNFILLHISSYNRIPNIR